MNQVKFVVVKRLVGIVHYRLADDASAEVKTLDAGNYGYRVLRKGVLFYFDGEETPANLMYNRAKDGVKWEKLHEVKAYKESIKETAVVGRTPNVSILRNHY